MPRLLIVEDEEPLRDSFSLILSTLPYESDIAANGKIALEMCQRSTYDLILLDLMMPVMDGVGFLKELLRIPNHARIIVMSNLSSSKLLEKALELGVHGSVLKSDISPTQLVTLIRRELASSNIPNK